MIKNVNSISWLGLGPFPGWVGFCASQKAFSKFLKEIELEDMPFLIKGAPATCHFISNESYNAARFIICIDHVYFQKKSVFEKVGILSHEALHAVQYLVEHSGDIGKEGEAYTLQYIVQSLFAWTKGQSK